MAGFRGPQAEVGFLFFRLVIPIGLFVLTLIYIFFLSTVGLSSIMPGAAAIAAAYIGIKAPEFYVSNKSPSARNRWAGDPRRARSPADCVELGMSIEPAFRKVAHEVGPQSIALAEEFTLTTAELSFLPDRRVAYENLAARTGVDALKQIVHGAEPGGALWDAARPGLARRLQQESRTRRMSEAEKKAAALPPKLTVPMILFFLPGLFAVIITPAVIQVTAVCVWPLIAWRRS